MSPERFAVLGDPVEHSLSPAMHTAAFRMAGLEAAYEAHRVSPSMLEAHVACLREGYRGFNVTVPHKQQILRSLDRIAPEAKAIGAVNTVVVDDGALTGFNTDPVGFLTALRAAGYDSGGKRAVVFGAGGAARAVVYALARAGETVTVVNRTLERALDLAADCKGRVTALSADELDVHERVFSADLIVNTTTLGMEHLADRSPLPPGSYLTSHAVVFDLVYGRETPLLRHAREQGCLAIDGLEMLVYQGSESFSLWTGSMPDTSIMREACLQALQERTCSVS